MARRGFSLVELLVLIGIGAIICSIAVPKFLTAQTNSQIARTEDFLRRFDVALETYRIDHDGPIPSRRLSGQRRKWVFARLTTPVSYLPGALADEFSLEPSPEDRYLSAIGPDIYLQPTTGVYAEFFQMFPRHSNGSDMIDRDFVFLYSVGPDQRHDVTDGLTPRAFFQYDPTNGAVSRGEIYRFNR